jgi:hypothetical protein
MERASLKVLCQTSVAYLPKLLRLLNISVISNQICEHDEYLGNDTKHLTDRQYERV